MRSHSKILLISIPQSNQMLNEKCFLSHVLYPEKFQQTTILECCPCLRVMQCGQIIIYIFSFLPLEHIGYQNPYKITLKMISQSPKSKNAFPNSKTMQNILCFVPGTPLQDITEYWHALSKGTRVPRSDMAPLPMPWRSATLVGHYRGSQGAQK